MGSDKLFHKTKFRTAKELARSEAKKSPYETVEIICEGQKTEFGYFNCLIKYLRLNTANITITPGKGSAPISIVEHAFEIMKKKPHLDRIACVFDQDNHESYQRAIKQLEDFKLAQKGANKPQLDAITSTPCFEIWPFLHFRYTTKPYSSTEKKSAADNLISDLKNEFPNYNKNATKWFNNLNDKLPTAIKNAKQLEKYNNRTNSRNPSTNIHTLVEYLINLKQVSNSSIAKEKWLWDNKTALHQIQKGLQDSASGRVKSRGSFAKFVDEEEQ